MSEAATVSKDRGAPSAEVPLEYLEREITELCGHINAATARWLGLIAEYDRREGWIQPGLRSCAHWLMWKCSLSLPAAREHVRVARALEDLPEISSAFSTGELSYSKVKALTRIATPLNETDLLHTARYSNAFQTERFVRLYRGTLEDSEELHQANRRHSSRYLTYHHDDAGMLVIHARLDPEEGAVVIKALEAAQDRLADNGPIELEEEGIAEVDLGGRGVPAGEPGTGSCSNEHQDSGGADAPVDEQDVPAGEPGTGSCLAERQRPRRADALVAMAESALHHGVAGRPGGDRYEVVLHVDAETLCHHDPSGRCELEGGPWLAPESARRIACDCSVVSITESQGQALSVGRKTRTIPPGLRRALRARDQGCRWPGCTEDRFTDGHHIVFWAHGGATSLTNLTTLCRHHHRLVHEGGFGVRVTAGKLVFTRPDGAVIEDAPATAAVEGADLAAVNRGLGLTIDSDTCLSLWEGDHMDYELSVWVLGETERLRGTSPSGAPASAPPEL